jgi:type VI protein secretion system component Hcp
MPLRPFLKINGVNGDATADAFEASFTVDDIGAQTPPGTPQTFSFNVKDLKTTAAVSSDIVLSDIVSNDSASSAIASSAGLSAVSAAVLVPASSPLQYFLKIDGVNGDSTVQGFEGWFSIDGFDIGVQNTGSVTGAGGGAGKTEFSPLTVDIHSLTGLASLFEDAAKGTHIPTVELAGAQTIKDQSVKVYDVKLSNVLVSSFENDPGPNGVETSLSFNYSKLSLTDQPATKHTIVGNPETFAFDLNKSEIAAAVSSDVASQINQMAMGLASFMASSQLGASSSQDLVSTQSTQQDNHLPTVAAPHA